MPGRHRDDPFLRPQRSTPVASPPADQQRLTQQITETVNNEVLPAYKRFAALWPLSTLLMAVPPSPHFPAGWRRAVPELHPQPHDDHRHDTRPDPPARTARDGSDRKEMLEIAHQEGFSDLASFDASLEKRIRSIFLRRPSRSSMTIVAILGRCRASCHSSLPIFPGPLLRWRPFRLSSLRWQPTIKLELRMASGPAGWSSRPTDFAHRSLIDDEATAYHEGIPGHHMQLSLRSR